MVRKARIILVAALAGCSTGSPSDPRTAEIAGRRIGPAAVDLAIGESADVGLWDGSTARVKLAGLEETVDELRQGVRASRVSVEVNGRPLILPSGTYNLPRTFGPVRIDCPITRGYLAKSRPDFKNASPWGLIKDARIRLWPADSPLLDPSTFQYPAIQRWFASATQMANEPSFVDGGEVPGTKDIYYHYGLDIGGSEGQVDVVAATDGVVLSAGRDAAPGISDTPVVPRYDVIYVRDARDWYYRYSHLAAIFVRVGDKVRMGQKIGLLGKEGGSGGWSHLHFDISSRQPSGLWGIQEGYSFLWEAYHRQYSPRIIAVARPHHYTPIGKEVTLDGTRSWSASRIVRYEWSLTDGRRIVSPSLKCAYDRPGEYSEILKITDSEGRTDFDFAAVLVVDPDRPKDLPPTLHAAYSPTFGIKPGDPVTFKVRAFRTTDGEELWDFGDGSPRTAVRSDGNVQMHAKDGYAITTHSYGAPGLYIGSVQRANRLGFTATARVKVRVSPE